MLTSVYNTIFLQPQKKEIHSLISAAAVLYICVWQWTLSLAVLPTTAAAIWAQWRCWCLRAVKRSQQSNICLQISAAFSYSTRENNALEITVLPPLPKGNTLTLPLWKWSWKIFEAHPWRRCGTPCPKSWWPFAQLVVCARDCHVLRGQELPFAIRCYKWSLVNQLFFCVCCPYDRGKISFHRVFINILYVSSTSQSASSLQPKANPVFCLYWINETS